jgi:hypothetical protein
MQIFHDVIAQIKEIIAVWKNLRILSVLNI